MKKFIHVKHITSFASQGDEVFERKVDEVIELLEQEGKK